MEGHTWIYVVALLGYLYFITKVYDVFNSVLLVKSRIKEPKTEREEDRKAWLTATLSIQQELQGLRKKSALLFLIVPLAELLLHFIIGNYDLSGQLLSLGFFILFSVVLLIVIFALKGRQSDRLEKKYTWKSEAKT